MSHISFQKPSQIIVYKVYEYGFLYWQGVLVSHTPVRNSAVLRMDMPNFYFDDLTSIDKLIDFKYQIFPILNVSIIL